MGDLRVARWLEQLGLSQYASTFSMHAVDWSVLPSLADHDLERLDIPLGHRKRILAGIACLDLTIRPSHHTFPAEPPGMPPLTPPALTDSDRKDLIESLGERRQITVVFCDMVGSTRLAHVLDPEDMRNVLRMFQRACAAVILRYEGFIAQYLGDGILIYFGFPQAHEDDAERAVRSALEIIEAMNAVNASISRFGDVEIAVRVGISTGMVVIGDLMPEGHDERNTAVGEPLNLAARLQAIAPPNTVVISDTTHRLLPNRFEFDDMGRQRLKGFPQPVRTWTVLGTRDADSRFEAKRLAVTTLFVGREREIDLLLECWRKAKEGTGQSVLICGDPGIGKSRLVMHAHDQLHDENHAYIRFHCSPFFRNSALNPVIDHLIHAAQIDRRETHAQRLAKLECLLGESECGVAPEIMSSLATLLEIRHGTRNPQVEISAGLQKKQTLDAVAAYIDRRAAGEPAVVVFEDAHWIDPTTEDLIELLMERLAGTPLLLLITHRPDYQPPWARRSNRHEIFLQRLNADQCAELIRGIAPDKAIPLQVVEQIVSRTDGIPLFAEELTKTILSSGLLALEKGQFVLRGPMPVRAIPTTIQDSLMARLDQLASPKEIAQVGSVIGREFSYELLAAVVETPENSLKESLHHLQNAQLLLAKGVPPKATYTFKHALVRDAAYESLLLARRRNLHGKIAEALENHFPEESATNPEVVAYHYTEAQQVLQAITHWIRAAERAAARSASVEAVNHLRKCLEILPSLADEETRNALELKVQVQLGTALMGVKGAGAQEVEEVYARALDLCEELPESPEHFAAMWGWWRISMNFQAGRERADNLLKLAENLDDPGLRLQAHHCLWATDFNLGRSEAALENIDRGLELYDEREHRAHATVYGGHDARVCAHGEAALALWLLGYPDRALERIGRTNTFARAMNHAGSIAHAHDITVMLHRYRRDPHAVRAVAKEMREFAEAKGFPDHVSKAAVFDGWARVMLGDHDDGLKQLERGIEIQREIGTREDFPVYFDMLAEAYLAVNRPKAGLNNLTDALAVAQVRKIHYWDAELARRRATLLAALDENHALEAEQGFIKALTLSRGQNAKMLELRAAVSLANLFYQQGRGGEGRAVLEPLVAWFHEGLDSVDLLEARQALERLGA